MGENEELMELAEKTMGVIKNEHAKILKLLEENPENCFGEGSKFATMEDYSVAIGTLTNCVTYMAQLDQVKKMQKAQKDNILQLQKNAKEAKK